MGRSFAPKYRVEISENGHSYEPSAWSVKDDGPACTDNLEKFVRSYAKSLEIGGVNQHISKSLGFLPYPVKARIIRQESGTVVAEWKAGMFQVW